MPEPAAAQPAKPAGSRSTGKRSAIALPVVLAGIVLCLVMAVVVLVAVVRPLLFPYRPTGIPLEITRVSSPDPAGPLPALPPPVIEVGDTAVSLATPLSLEIGERVIPVLASDPQGESWIDPEADPAAAIWVYGTVVNYVLGLQDNEDNRAIVEQLSDDTPLLLVLSSGTRLTFRVAQNQEATPNDPALLAQAHPGLTLALLGEDAWQVVSADFENAEEVLSTSTETPVTVGQTVQVGDVRVTVEQGYARSSGELAAGTMAYLVEFSVQNTGQVPIDSRAFLMELVDRLENRYLFSSELASLGNYGPLPETIAPAAQVQATVGYLVPEGLTGPELLWTMRPNSASSLQARFAIPYTSPSSGAALPDVDITQAFLGEGGTVLHVVAQVRNQGNATLQVTTADIALSSSGGAEELVAAAPPLPWAIDGGQQREIELQFSRPSASTCVVTILGYTFEISGLP